tara:strand:- start:6619 stop:6795 length:177 start_codon:yes stop_codon:yes gene_type:complete
MHETKKDKLSKQEVEVIEGFINWCATNEVSIKFSIQEKTSDGYVEREKCTIPLYGEKR